MALVRVYCGVATAEIAPWLTVAVVDDAGRLLDMRHISDDPAGYAYLVALLAERSGGSFPVAADHHEHLVVQLLAAANRPLAIADDMTVQDFAERFADETSYDEMQAPISQRRAVGLARALQAGALYATAQSPSWDMDELKPVLAAHAAVTAGRQAAAVAMREVLRELYPAALRAYLDPAEFIPLKILDAFPEPGLLSTAPSTRTRETALVTELTSSGVTDATTAVNAITALRVAVEESRSWNSNRMIAPAVAETVRQAVAAVRACDAATAALVGSLVERLSSEHNGGAAASNVGTRPQLVHPAAPVSPAVSRRAAPGPAAEVPPARISPRASAASAAAAGVGVAGIAAAGSGTASMVTTVGGPSPSYDSPSYDSPSYESPAYESPAAYGIPAPRQEPSFADSGFPEPGFPPPGTRGNWPTNPATEDEYANGYGYDNGQAGYDQSSYDQPAYDQLAYSNGNGYASPGYEAAAHGAPSHAAASYQDPAYDQAAYAQPADDQPTYGGHSSGPSSGGPTNGSQSNGAGYGGSSFAPGSPGWESTYGGGTPPAYGPDNLSFSTDPLSAPLDTTGQIPRLRLVESPPFADPTPHPALRVIDGGRQDDTRSADDDLLIFSDMQSAWFTDVDVESLPLEPLDWAGQADDGWRAAEQLTHPSTGPDTTAGLPRRVPQANLVPGSAEAQPRQLRIVRDAKSIAAHTEGYFRGWRRGQEVGGFPVGQRDRAAWEFNREQRARQGAARLS